MIPTWFFVTAGIILLCLSAWYYIVKLQVSFDTEGGVLGMVPILDGCVFPPFWSWFGLSLIERGTEWPDWPIWGYVLGTLATMYVSLGGLCIAGKLGERHHRR